MEGVEQVGTRVVVVVVVVAIIDMMLFDKRVPWHKHSRAPRIHLHPSSVLFILSVCPIWSI